MSTLIAAAEAVAALTRHHKPLSAQTAAGLGEPYRAAAFVPPAPFSRDG